MADQVIFPKACSEIDKMDTFSFEKHVKTSLLMKRQDWNNLGQLDTKFHRFCRSLTYWRKELEPAISNETLMITVYQDSQEAYINLEKLVSVIENIVPINSLIGFFRPRNKKIIGLDFDSEINRNKVATELRKIEEAFVVDLDWARLPRNIEAKIHWLPRITSLKEISVFFNKYSEVISIEREETVVAGRARLQTGIINVKAVLKEGQNIEDIPHLTQFGNLQALVIIGGRSVMCLGCHKLGHIVANCPTPFCRVCRARKIRRHDCVLPSTHQTYAQIASNSNEFIDTTKYDIGVQKVKHISTLNLQKELADKMNEETIQLSNNDENSNNEVSVNINVIAGNQITMNKEDKIKVKHSNFENVKEIEQSSEEGLSDENMDVNASIIKNKADKLENSNNDDDNDFKTKRMRKTIDKTQEKGVKIIKTYSNKAENRDQLTLSNKFEVFVEKSSWADSSIFMDSEVDSSQNESEH